MATIRCRGFDNAEFERLCTVLQTCVEVWKSAAYVCDAQEAAKIAKLQTLLMILRDKYAASIRSFDANGQRGSD